MSESIKQILAMIDKKQLHVPAFQREYVWKRDDAKSLLNSLIKKYPTGTLLTWLTNTPPELKGGHKYDPMQGAIKIILDGQQRITTLYMIINGEIPPYYTEQDIKKDIRNLYVNLETLDLEYYKPKTMKQNPLWQNLTDIFQNTVKAFHIVKELKEIKEVDEILEENIHDNVNNIKLIEDREFVEQSIPVTASIREAIDIFYIVNASGVNLTDAELALAQISGYWAEARELFKIKLSKLEKSGFVFNLDFIVYVLAGTMFNTGSELKKLHAIENREKIKEVWEKIDNTVLDYTCNILQSKGFVDHTKEINSVYALIPIIVYVYRKLPKKLTDIEIRKIIRWFYYSQIRQRYVSQLPQKLDMDCKIAATNDNPFDELLSIIKAERPLEISKDEFVGATVQHPLFNLMKWYFKSKNAVCFGTGLALRKNMGVKYELEKDHIFAWSILRENGYGMSNRHKYSMAQEICNRAMLTLDANRSKSSKEASKYLSEVQDNYPNALKLQSVPEDSELWKVENYELFLDTRRKLLAKEFNSYLDNITQIQETNGHLSIAEIISHGENEFLEFKSSLRWDLRNLQVNKKMEEIIMKSIAAFSNKDGGTLLIGVADDGETIGLEDDYASLKEGNKDVFELHLRNLVNTNYGKEFAATNISVSFPFVNNVEICQIDIKKGIKPIFTNVQDKNGQTTEKFYIRSGNSSQELAGFSEVNSYIKNNFEN